LLWRQRSRPAAVRFGTAPHLAQYLRHQAGNTADRADNIQAGMVSAFRPYRWLKELSHNRRAAPSAWGSPAQIWSRRRPAIRSAGTRASKGPAVGQPMSGRVRGPSSVTVCGRLQGGTGEPGLCAGARPAPAQPVRPDQPVAGCRAAGAPLGPLVGDVGTRIVGQPPVVGEHEDVDAVSAEGERCGRTCRSGPDDDDVHVEVCSIAGNRGFRPQNISIPFHSNVWGLSRKSPMARSRSSPL